MSGERKPISSISARVPACIARIASPFAKDAVDHAHVGDHAAVLVEDRVEDQRAGRRARDRPAGGGILFTIASSTSSTPSPVLAEIRRMLVGIVARAARAISWLTRSGSALGEVDLVQDRDQLEPGVDRQVGVRERLRLDALCGVDHQQAALAGGERARDLVVEVDVAGGVDQVQLVGLAVAGRVEHAHRLRLDRDAALALEVHRVEQLAAHLGRVDRVRELEDAVGERRLAVVDVGDDREVPDLLHVLQG